MMVDLSKFDNDVDEIPFPELDAVDFSNIQKELLLKHFEKTPNLIGVDTNVFLLSTNENVSNPSRNVPRTPTFGFSFKHSL